MQLASMAEGTQGAFNLQAGEGWRQGTPQARRLPVQGIAVASRLVEAGLQLELAQARQALGLGQPSQLCILACTRG